MKWQRLSTIDSAESMEESDLVKDRFQDMICVKIARYLAATVELDEQKREFDSVERMR